MEELWKQIPGYEGIYEASNLGQIRSVEGKVTYTERHHYRVWKSRIIKQKYQNRKGNTGYKDARVILWKDGKWKTHLVSRLVALAWVDGFKEGYTVNHIDGNPLNNCADNLEWMSLVDNIRHGFANGLYKTNQRPCILTDELGNKYIFASLSDTDRFLNRSNGYIRNLIFNNRNNARSISGEIYTVSA